MWYQTLKLSPHWSMAVDKTISNPKLAELIADRLSELRPYPVSWIEKYRNNIEKKLRGASQKESLSDEDIDDLMEDLYTWGDLLLNAKSCQKVCLIEIVEKRVENV